MPQTTTEQHRQRLKAGYTLRDLAKACEAEGVSVHWTQLGQIDRGNCLPRPRLRAVLARLLEMDIEAFEREAS